MSTKNFQQLLKQFDYGIAEVGKQKQAFCQLALDINNLDRCADSDPDAREQLEALARYQQSERYAQLREKAEKELAELQLQFSRLQQEPEKEMSSLLESGITKTVAQSASLPKANKRKTYI